MDDRLKHIAKVSYGIFDANCGVRVIRSHPGLETRIELSREVVLKLAGTRIGYATLYQINVIHESVTADDLLCPTLYFKNIVLPVEIKVSPVSDFWFTTPGDYMLVLQVCIADVPVITIAECQFYRSLSTEWLAACGVWLESDMTGVEV